MMKMMMMMTMMMIFFIPPTLSVTENSCGRGTREVPVFGTVPGVFLRITPPNRLLGHRDGAQGFRATHRHTHRRFLASTHLSSSSCREVPGPWGPVVRPSLDFVAAPGAACETAGAGATFTFTGAGAVSVTAGSA